MLTVQLSGLLLAAFCCLIIPPANAGYHIVGGSLSRTIPPNKTYFQDWAKERVFGVHDKLLFQFRALHNVVEVSKDDFERCTKNNVIKTYYVGPLVVNCTHPGDHYYYYSSVGKQCEIGQKLCVVVVAGQGSTDRTLHAASGIVKGH